MWRMARRRDGAHHDRSFPLHHRTDAAGRVSGIELLRAVAVGDRAPRGRSRACSTATTGRPRLARPSPATPTWAGRFRAGDRVRVRNPVTSGHTRVPRYLRLHVGRIERVACAWPNPGESAATGNVRRARAGVHRRLRRRRAVRRCRRPHTHRRPRGERPGGTMSDLTPAQRSRDPRAPPSRPRPRRPRRRRRRRRRRGIGVGRRTRARPSARASSRGPGSTPSSGPGCSPTPSTPSPSTSRRPCRSPCSRTRRRCIT